MGNLTDGEIAAIKMRPTHDALLAVRAFDAAATKFIKEELPADDQPDALGVTRRLQLVAEFNDIWPHRVPGLGELLVADHAGHLEEKIRELNDEFECSKNASSARKG